MPRRSKRALAAAARRSGAGSRALWPLSAVPRPGRASPRDPAHDRLRLLSPARGAPFADLRIRTGCGPSVRHDYATRERPRDVAGEPAAGAANDRRRHHTLHRTRPRRVRARRGRTPPQPHGTLHGGIFCDITDAAMGIAYDARLEEGESFTTLEQKINFLKPVRSGKLRAEARFGEGGRTVGMVECDVTDAGGSLVARASSTLHDPARRHGEGPLSGRGAVRRIAAPTRSGSKTSGSRPGYKCCPRAGGVRLGRDGLRAVRVRARCGCCSRSR